MAPDQVIYFCWFGRSSRCASDYEVPDHGSSALWPGASIYLVPEGALLSASGQHPQKTPKGVSCVSAPLSHSPRLSIKHQSDAVTAFG